MSNYSTRPFNEIKKIIKFGTKKIIKTSSYTNKFYDEIKWLVSLPNDLKVYAPNISNFFLVKDSKDNFVEYDFIATETVHNYFIANNMDEVYWNKCANKYKEMINSFLKHTPKSFDYKYWKEQIFWMYFKKTKDRLSIINTYPDLCAFINNEFVYINGQKFPSVKKIINILDAYMSNNAMNSVFDQFFQKIKDRICIVHGDLTFSNVFYSLEDDKMTIIDPRGSFGIDKIYGDVLEEYAKVYQSIYGCYDYVIKDRFTLTEDANKFNYSFDFFSNYEIIKKAFNDFFPKEYISLIKLVTSFFLLSMFPFHSENVKHQKMFLCIGIQMFFEAINNNK